MTYALLTAALTGALLLTGCANDGPGHRRGPPGFGDIPREAALPAGQCLLKPIATAGTLTRQQMDEAIRDSFVAADTNKDGALDATEVRALNASRASSCDNTPLIDWSGTGRVGLTAYGARYRTVFAQADTDGDGVVTPAEMDHVPRMPHDKHRGHPPGGQRPDGPQIAAHAL